METAREGGVGPVVLEAEAAVEEGPEGAEGRAVARRFVEVVLEAVGAGAWEEALLGLEEELEVVLGTRVRSRSPRITASAWITVRPPRIMFVVPWICERRETLLPVSCGGC